MTVCGLFPHLGSLESCKKSGKNIFQIGIDKRFLLYRYRWNTRISPFTEKSHLHRPQWRYYFYLSRVRILVSTWLLIWLASYKRASRSGARSVLLKFHSQNGFEVRRQYGNRWLCRWAAKFNLHIDPFSEFEEHSRRFAEVSESDVEKFIEGEENANTKNKTFYDL